MYVRGGGYPLLNNGFTLIELLAVVVILAIIALIAVPIILNIIGDTRVSAAKRSAENYIDAVELYLARSELDTNKVTLERNNKYNVTNSTTIGEKIYPKMNDLVEITGGKPTGKEDYVQLNEKGKVIEAELTMNGYKIVIKNGKIVSATKGDTIALQSISLNYTEQTMEKDSTFKLIPIFNPENASNQEVTYKSSDTSIVTVDAQGNVTAVNPGSTKVLVTSKEDTTIKAECNITVVVSATGLIVSPVTSKIKVGETVQLTGAITPSNVTTNSLTWKSSNADIASVDSNGLVTGVSVGEVVITASTVNGIEATSKITVKLTIPSPTYSLDTTERATRKTVTITYPEIDGKVLVYEYSIDGGQSWKSAIQSQQVSFTSPGTVIARVTDDEDIVTGKFFPVTNIGEVLNPQGTYLMKSSYTSSSETTFLGGTINKSIVESIVVTNTKKVPENVLGSWDASEAKDGSINAWYFDKDNNGLYELYIGGDGGVKANPNSSYLFNQFNKATTIDVSYLDTSKVTNMSNMFYNCSKLTNLNINNLDTSKITNMSNVFEYCYELTALDVSNFDTSKVTNMSGMFYHCDSLIDLDLSKFNTSNVESMSQMFRWCKSLTTLNVSKFNTSNVTNMSYMFSDCVKLTTLDVSKFNTINVLNMWGMFSGCNSLTTLNVSNFDTKNVTNMSGMFSVCESLTTLNVSNFDTSKVTNMSGMFNYCKNLSTLDLSKFNTSNVESMSQMFRECQSLTTLNVSNFDTSKVTNMFEMFNDCVKLTTLDLNSFDTSNVTNMGSMFYNCPTLTNINMKIATFDSVTKYDNIFKSSTKLTQIAVKDTSAKTFIEARLADVSKTGVTVSIA